MRRLTLLPRKKAGGRCVRPDRDHPTASARFRPLRAERLEDRLVLSSMLGESGGQAASDSFSDSFQEVPIAEDDYGAAGLAADGLIHHWRFDDGQGFTADDAISTADGTLAGMAGDAWTAGYHGSALAFDGADDHVSVGQAPSLQLTDEVTIAAWVKVASGGFGNWIGIAGWIYDTGRWDESGYALHTMNNGGFAFSLETVNDSSNNLDPPEANGYALDRWYHVAGTYDGSSVLLYVDGALVAGTPESGRIRWDFDDGDGFEIGRYHDNNEDNRFRGLIDDVRVYDRALDAGEVLALADEAPTSNNAPVAKNDSVMTDGQTPRVIDVLANDRDADGEELSIVEVTQPADGAVVDNHDGTLTYTPGAGFQDSDSFAYTVSDGSGGTDTAMVTVVEAPFGQWDFDDPGNLTAATMGTDLILVGTDEATAGVIPGDGATMLGVGDYYIVDHGMGPNGGGSLVNEYTLVFDFEVPALGQWASFFQTNESNSNDGDLFVRNSDARIGVGATGYSPTSIQAATWYRLVVVVDNGSRFDIYLDGARILDGTPQSIDGRFGLEPTLLILADQDGEDNPMDLSMFAIFDHALSDVEVAQLGGPYPLDPDNTPPAMVIVPPGPASGETQIEIPFMFGANDVDGDAVQFQIDWGDGEISPWSDFQSVTSVYITSHAYNVIGAMQIRANVRDEHGAASGFTLIHTIEISGDVVAEFVTMPYLQNMTPESMVIMWEMDAAAAVTVEYGLTTDYGSSTAATSEASGFGTHIFKAELAGLLIQSEYHYRLVTDGGSPMTGDRLFKTGTDAEVDFSFGSWSDSQGSNHGAWTADPLEPTSSMMAHMAQNGVAFGFTTGDLAENGGSYSDTRNYYLDRVAKYLGQTVPWFNTWGNHDTSSPNAIIRRFADMPSKERPGYTPGFGSFYFTYANVLFIAIDHFDQGVITSGWLESLLQSDINQNARFTVLGVHVPPYSELWINGSSTLRRNLVPLLEQYGVDVVISGHTHEYERGFLNGVYYVMTGGGSWLDLPEPLVYNWPHMTVGGYDDLPGSWAQQSSPGVLGPPQPIRAGLVNEYVKFEIIGNHLEVDLHAFNADGSYIGVLDSFAFGDTPGANDPPSFNGAVLEKSSALSGIGYGDSLSGDATDPDLGDVLSFSKTAGPAWLSVAADGTLSGAPGAGAVGESSFTVRVTDTGGLFDEATLKITVEQGPSAVVGRYVFYNNSAFDGYDPGAGGGDDNAIAPDKVALLPGGTATFENYTSYVPGINGIMVDMLYPLGTITATDFEFAVGNDDTPGDWAPVAVVPIIDVRPGEGAYDSDRVTIIFPDDEIQTQWLEVTVRATANTGLAGEDLFYFGNALGETGNLAGDAIVNLQDILTARNNPHPFWDPAPVDNHYDFDRDQRVDATDILIARANQTWSLTALELIDLSGGKAAAGKARIQDAVTEQVLGRESGRRKPSSARMAWLYEFVQPLTKRQASNPDNSVENAVDALLALNSS